MAYHTILVNLNAHNRAATLMKVATSLARKQSAHLIGLYAIPAVDILPMTAPMELPPEIIEARHKQYEELAAQAKSLFEEVTRIEDFSSEWRCVDVMGTQIGAGVVEHARMADLVIAGQGDPEAPSAGQAGLAEQLIMESGRPVLVVPRSGEFEDIGELSIVAWNASQQSSRATFDALPLLKASKGVKLLWVNPEHPKRKDAEIIGSEMATILARHGVKIEATHFQTDGKSVGEALLGRVADHGADLLVMGGYGHSRLREYVFGGVTRYVLENMTTPILMSR